MEKIVYKKQNTKVKICGLYRLVDITYVNEALPDYVGFIIGFPQSHRNIGVKQVIDFSNMLNPKIEKVGVFVNASFEEIIAVSAYLDVIQLHGDEDNCYIEKIRQLFPRKEIWKAFKIRTIRDLENAVDSIADRIVLDNGYGTGETFEWDLLKHITNANKSFIIAGGMKESNVLEVIERFHPYGIDVSSGVETEKQKDKMKIQKVVTIIRGE